MKTKILLVEDDADFGSILKHYMELSNFDVFWFQDPEEIAKKIEENFCYDIGILDIMMPKLDGFSLAKIILEKKPNFPILFLTAKNQPIDRITGLKIGADDYIAKPCDPEELILRIQNILKRTNSALVQIEIKIGDYILNSDKLLLQHKTGNIRLTLKEKNLLVYLLKFNNQTVKREQILKEIWKTNDYFTGRSMDVFISRLRKYLANDSKIKIESLRGIGFEINIPL
ncbi:MAG: response regulator transcription factor [Flavobacterium sp.]